MTDFRSLTSRSDVEAALKSEIFAFNYENAIVVRLGEWGMRDAIVISYPRQALEFYFHKRCAAQDPILKHMLCSKQPFFWCDISEFDLEQEVDRAAAEFMAVMSELGVRDGVSIPLPPFQGQRAVLSLSARRNVRPPLNKLGRLTLMAAGFWEAWMSFALDDETGGAVHVVPPGPMLTERQLVCLQYCQEGMSSQQIGQMLGVCENTVQFHISNAMEELGASNRIHAVARAMELGFLKHEEGRAVET